MPSLPDMPVSFSVMPLMASAAKWIFYFIISGGSLLVIYSVFTYFQYNIKVTYWPLYGSSKDGVFSVGKLTTNRARWNKSRNAWKMLWPFMNKKEHPPFDSEHIYPGNNVFAFKINQNYIPGRFNTDVQAVSFEEEEEEFFGHVKDLAGLYNIDLNLAREYFPIKIGGSLNENAIRGSLDPVEFHLDKWLQAYSKETIQEFKAEDWWDQNKHFFMVLGTAFICLIMVGVCVWFIYKMMSEGRPEAAAMTSALNNLAGAMGQNGGVVPT